jgi:hypothetical protein
MCKQSDLSESHIAPRHPLISSVSKSDFRMTYYCWDVDEFYKTCRYTSPESEMIGPQRLRQSKHGRFGNTKILQK